MDNLGTIIGIVVVAAIVGVIVFVVVIGARLARQAQGDDDGDPVLARLAEATQRGENVSLEDIELQQPFMQRVVVPVARRMGEISARFTPEKLLQETTLKIELAGNPGRIDAATFLATRFVGAAIFGGLLALISNMPQVTWPLGRIILVVTLFTVLGFFFPQMWLSSRITRRQNEVRKALPDALDLLTICVEAGLGFEAAMSKVADKWENELSIMFGRCIREIQLGKTQREAMRDMADRIGLPELTSFVAAVIQSQLLGVSMAKVLRIQSDQMRMKRRQRAEEEAHKAPVKMIIPMALLTFPSIMIILMAPAAFQIADAFAPFLGN
ncbi:MAG: type II secretion system F family protein [Anaerolineales bacterium]|jgi:tight adherence protein C|nr:type II secretion system F family protein [Chloroflexota bacterium]MBK6645755.1 type II secretion system F family protein [Anaerolineales bacterium]MCC6984895.1 type II secretion system F family protein [Anaerolineales bacterium]